MNKKNVLELQYLFINILYLKYIFLTFLDGNIYLFFGK